VIKYIYFLGQYKKYFDRFSDHNNNISENITDNSDSFKLIKQ